MDTLKSKGKGDVAPSRKEKILSSPCVIGLRGVVLTLRTPTACAPQVGIPPAFSGPGWSKSNLTCELHLETPSGNQHSELVSLNADFLHESPHLTSATSHRKTHIREVHS